MTLVVLLDELARRVGARRQLVDVELGEVGAVDLVRFALVPLEVRPGQAARVRVLDDGAGRVARLMRPRPPA